MASRWALACTFILMAGLVPIQGAPGSEPGGSGKSSGGACTANFWYVADEAPGASDSNDGKWLTYQGGTKGPWKTLTYAAGGSAPVIRCDFVFVQNGTYNGTVDVKVSAGFMAPISFIANGTRVIIDGKGAGQAILLNGNNRQLEWIYFKGFEVTGADTNIDITRSQNITLRNLRVHDAFSTNINPITSHNITIQDSEIWGAKGEHGIYCSNGCDDLIIRNNSIHDNNWTGIQVNSNPDISADKIAYRALIENNIISGNGAGGAGALTFASVRDSLVRNNLLKDNLGGGIILWAKNVAGYGSKNNVIVSNTVYFQDGNGRYGLSLQDDSSGNLVADNILVSGNGAAFQFEESSLAGLRSDHNVLYRWGGGIVRNLTSGRDIWLPQWTNWSGQDSRSFIENPANLFVNSSQGDLHLKGGAVAIDSGTSAPPEVPPADIESRPRADDPSFPNKGAGPADYYDIGAYEFPGVPPPPPRPLKGTLTPDSASTFPNATLPLRIRVEDSLSGVGVAGATVALDDGVSGGSFSIVTEGTSGNYTAAYRPVWYPASRDVTLNASLSKAGSLSAKVSATVRVVVNGSQPDIDVRMVLAASPLSVTNPANITVRITLSEKLSGAPIPGATVTVNDGGAGGKFDPMADHGNGTYETLYRPATVSSKTSVALNAQGSKSGHKDSFASLVVEVRPAPGPAPPPPPPKNETGGVTYSTILLAGGAIVVAAVLGVVAIALLRRRRPRERYRAPAPAFLDGR